VIDYAVAWLGLELEKRQEELNANLRILKEEKQRIEGGLHNLVEVIAVGKGSPAVMAAINERENRIRAITNQLLEPGPGSLQEKLDELRAVARKHLAEILRLLAKPENVHEARAAIAEMFGTFTLSPLTNSGGWSYSAKGSVDFFGQTTLDRFSRPAIRDSRSSRTFAPPRREKHRRRIRAVVPNGVQVTDLAACRLSIVMDT